ncbi:hypothetical protein Lepto7375DRAFT_6252 [Leptolyngbya sp. PCC 7375]|nr:hypothetical protein Lepto7375DRAFT_6252 [Leptolyngbya sp. PCC 7375]
MAASELNRFHIEVSYLTAMIKRSSIVNAIKYSVPDFASTCDAFVVEWSEELELPYYLLLGEFSRYLIFLLEANDKKQLKSAFELIESLCRDDDEYVREAATIGILENIQNANLHARIEPNQLIEYHKSVKP